MLKPSSPYRSRVWIIVRLGGDEIVVIVNFSGRELRSYSIGLPNPGSWKVRFNGDRREYDDSFGDFGVLLEVIDAKKVNRSCYEAIVNIGAYSGLILSRS